MIRDPAVNAEIRERQIVYRNYFDVGVAIGTGNNIREYDEGSLTIDFVDAASQTLLWRGTGTQRFQEYKDPEKASRDIDTLVEKILAQFPPQT